MKTDFIEDGHGSAVMLIHSTVAGNKQWRKLIEYLSHLQYEINYLKEEYGITEEVED